MNDNIIILKTGDGTFLCPACVDPDTKKQRNPKKKSHPFHLPTHTFWDLDAEFSSCAMSAMHRKEDKTWTNIHGKTGGGMWERGEPFLKNAYAVAQSGRYQASGAPGWNDGKGLVFVRELTPVKNRARGVVQAPDCVTLNPQISAGYRFGASLDLKWPLLAVGSPGHSNKAGAAYLFLYQAGVWTPLGARMHEKAATRLGFAASQPVPETEAEGSATGANEVLKWPRAIIITNNTNNNSNNNNNNNKTNSRCTKWSRATVAD
jgi:hypothetical protein